MHYNALQNSTVIGGSMQQLIISEEIQQHIQRALNELDLAQRKIMARTLEAQAKSASLARATALGLALLGSGIENALDPALPVDAVLGSESPHQFDQRVSW